MFLHLLKIRVQDLGHPGGKSLYLFFSALLRYLRELRVFFCFRFSSSDVYPEAVWKFIYLVKILV